MPEGWAVISPQSSFVQIRKDGPSLRLTFVRIRNFIAVCWKLLIKHTAVWRVVLSMLCSSQLAPIHGSGHSSPYKHTELASVRYLCHAECDTSARCPSRVFFGHENCSTWQSLGGHEIHIQVSQHLMVTS